MKSRVLIIALSVLSPIFVSAKPGTEHCKDMVDVLGIPQDKTSAAYRHANEVAKTITAMIDQEYWQLLANIRGVAPNFSLGPSRHRIFFHWGFNENPQHGEELARQINDATADESVRTKIWEMVKTEQGRRNRIMMEKVSIEFNCNSGLMTIRSEQNAIASLMYNAHILGDYEVSASSQTKGMVSINVIIADTLRSVSQRLKDPDMKIVSEFKQRLNAIKPLPEGSSIKAQKVLEAMKTYMPKILRANRRMRRIVYGEQPD